MNGQNEIIEMARQAGLKQDDEMWFSPSYYNCDVHIAELEAFAKLVAAKEREACADLCYQLVDNSRETRFASAIRARA